MTEVTTSPRRRGVKLLAAAGLLGAVALAPALPAGAGIVGTFTATPSPVAIGEVLTFTATGCADADALELAVVVESLDEEGTPSLPLPVDEDGTAVLPILLDGDEVEPGTYTFAATCEAIFEEGEGPEVLFTYNEVTVTITGGTPTTVTTPTTTPSTAPSTTARPATGAVATPRFTG